MIWPAPPNVSPCCHWSGKGTLSGYTHLISPESCPQGKLLILLQETDFHIVDFVPIKHHQNIGFCPGLRGTVSDQESAVLEQKEEWSLVRQGSNSDTCVFEVPKWLSFCQTRSLVQFNSMSFY